MQVNSSPQSHLPYFSTASKHTKSVASTADSKTTCTSCLSAPKTVSGYHSAPAIQREINSPLGSKTFQEKQQTSGWFAAMLGL
jgi:hypothetical protein